MCKKIQNPKMALTYMRFIIELGRVITEAVNSQCLTVEAMVQSPGKYMWDLWWT
jgi:hypothetical protein